MSEPSYEELKLMYREAKQKLDSREAGLPELDVTVPEPKPVIPEKVVIKTCHHIKEDGRRCGSPSVTDRRYCCFHLSIRGRRLKMAQARARGQRYRLELPPLEDLYAVQVGIQQVLDALSSGQLDRRLGGVMLYGLQQAGNNLRLPEEVWEKSGRFDNVAKTTWKGFEQAHGLPEGFDVNTPPDEAFPPAAASPGTIELTGEDQVTEDDIGLDELLQSDPEACKRRANRLARRYRQRIRRDEEKLDRVLRVLAAAHGTAEAQQKKEPASVKAEAAGATGSAEAVSAEPEPGSPASAGLVLAGVEQAPASGAGAKKPPQGEPDKKQEPAEGAS